MRILIVANSIDNGLFYHRMLVPYENLQKLTGIEVMLEKDKSIQNIPDIELKWYSHIVFLRNVSINGDGVLILNRLKSFGIKTIIDIDDYPELHQSHGLAKAYNHYNIFEQVKKELAACDIVTTTTDYFAKWIRNFNNNVFVIPNCINTNHSQWTIQDTYSDKIRFGWAGGIYHEKDIDLLDRPIIKAYRKFKNIQFVLGGYNNNKHYHHYERVFSGNCQSDEYKKYLALNTQLQEHLYWHEPYRRVWGKSVYEYGSFYNLIDVSLIPLCDIRFNNYKSEIKLIEAGTMKKPVIVSDTLPYNIFPKDTALFVKTQNDWLLAFKKMMSKDCRDEYAGRLNEYVLKNYDLDSWTIKRYQCLA